MRYESEECEYENSKSLQNKASSTPSSQNTSASLEASCSQETTAGDFLKVVSIMSNGRWIKFYEKYTLSSVYKDTHAKNVLNHLLITAQWKSGIYKTTFKGREIRLNAGQVVIGRYRLANELGESPSNIRNALKRLKTKYGILDYESDYDRTIVTILNWDTYQKEDKKEDYQEDLQRTSKGQRKDSERTLINKDRKKNDIKTDCKTNVHVVSKFDMIWMLYPNRVGKKVAERHFNKSVKTEEEWKNINIALDNYKLSEKFLKGYIQNGSTWFNDWESWIDYKPQFSRPMTEAQKVNAVALRKFRGEEHE